MNKINVNQDGISNVGTFYKKNGKWCVEKGCSTSGNSGFIFKSGDNYDKDDDTLPVYQAEYQEGLHDYYTRKDFETLAGELSQQLFDDVDWQHPGSLFEEWED